jgi:hypothetical protein
MNKKLNRNPSARTKADSDKMPIFTTSATILPNPMLAVCAMSMTPNSIDVSRYGFVLDAETKYSKTYLANVKNEIVQLVFDGDVCTIRIAGKRNIMVANRYKVSNQEQLDFLLANGRVGVLFSSFGGFNKT